MPWRNKEGHQPMKIAPNQATADLLARLREMARFDKYDEDEAQDVCKAACTAAASYLENTAPDADFVVISTVPFRSDRPGVIGTAVCQRMAGGVVLDRTMKSEIVPQLARHFYRTLGERLAFCWAVLFGKNPPRYEREDRN